MRVTCLAPSDDLDYAPVFTQVLDNAIDTVLTVDTFYPQNSDLPDDHDTDRIIITGSEFHVYDREDWVDRTQEYVLDALKQNIPVLGVCYGHQLLADALGGTVEQLHCPGQEPLTDREMGYNTISLTAAGRDSPLFHDFPDRFCSFTSHMDYVSSLPSDAVPLAQNPYGNHGFQSTACPAYGIQFHPEYDLALAQQLLDEKDLTREQRAAIEDTLTAENEQKAEQTRAVFTNFLTRI